jgi:hypothetical protein
MSADKQVHVISKENIADHTVVDISETSLPQLQDGHVRVRTAIISLTVNTQTYARLGNVRNWWDTYPVPKNLPSPYNDGSRYGICPAWGYSEVIESKVSGIQVGELVWGFWPTSSLPVDLKLVPADVPGHWYETTEARSTLMNLYQRYVIPNRSLRVQSLDEAKWTDMAWEAALTVWQAGYLLNAYIFGRQRLHPLGPGEWSESDADITSAVVIALSASGKTARGFLFELATHRAPGDNPLGLLSITSAKNNDFVPKASFPTKTVSYQQANDGETMDWIAERNPSKIVIVDFGGRGDSLHTLLEALKVKLNQAQAVVIGVGGAADTLTPKDVGAWAQKTATLDNRIQMNTSGLRDVAMEKYGAKEYFDGFSAAWKDFVKSSAISDLKLEIRDGVSGDNGFEGGWTEFCKGNVPADVAMVYRF